MLVYTSENIMLHVYSILKEPAHLGTQGTVLNNRES